MKLGLAKQRLRAMTLIEVLVVIAGLAVLAALLLPVIAGSHRVPQKINCASNLKQINLAFRIWEGDNNNQYPMGVSSSIGGAMELICTGNVAPCFQVASNELSTTRILVCPQDNDRTYASNFAVLDASHISYFIGADVTNEDNPQSLLDGDDNFEINGAPVQSGILDVTTNSSLAWGAERHVSSDSHFWTPSLKRFYGNLGYADGSVSPDNTLGLQHALQQTGVATNRLAIP